MRESAHQKLTCPPTLLQLQSESTELERIKKEFKDRWLPTAVNACRELETISSNAEDIKNSHEVSCELMEEAFPDDQEKMKALIAMKCKLCGKDMRSLKKEIDTSIESWKEFISKNCTEKECEIIHNKIEEWKQELANR